MRALLPYRRHKLSKDFKIIIKYTKENDIVNKYKPESKLIFYQYRL